MWRLSSNTLSFGVAGGKREDADSAGSLGKFLGLSIFSGLEEQGSRWSIPGRESLAVLGCQGGIVNGCSFAVHCSWGSLVEGRFHPYLAVCNIKCVPLHLHPGALLSLSPPLFLPGEYAGPRVLSRLSQCQLPLATSVFRPAIASKSDVKTNLLLPLKPVHLYLLLGALGLTAYGYLVIRRLSSPF